VTQITDANRETVILVCAGRELAVEKIIAALVSDGGEPFEKLELALDSQGAKTYRARDSAEVLALLEQPDPPQMIFTGTNLSDGTWVDVLRLAARHLVPVIVVSRRVDFGLYVDSLERGALDVIVPPFVGADLAHIVRCAAWNWSNGRVRPATRSNAQPSSTNRI
jgi:DNA-binding response OmpR family regulator